MKSKSDYFEAYERYNQDLHSVKDSIEKELNTNGFHVEVYDGFQERKHIYRLSLTRKTGFDFFSSTWVDIKKDSYTVQENRLYMNNNDIEKIVSIVREILNKENYFKK